MVSGARRRKTLSQLDLSAPAAVSKKVRIDIAVEDIGTLKSNGYSLCVAKKVLGGGSGDGYTVVWQSSTRYLATNDLSWTPQYALFGGNRFDSGGQVRATTNQQAVGLGQRCVLDRNGVLQPPATGGPATAITLANDYGSIHAGLSQMINWLDGGIRMVPMHLAPRASVVGEEPLTPVEQVLIWFEQYITTSTMFSTARPNAVEVDMSRTDRAAVRYSNGRWSTP